jgi:hypothetical protein
MIKIKKFDSSKKLEVHSFMDGGSILEDYLNYYQIMDYFKTAARKLRVRLGIWVFQFIIRD